MCLTRCSVCLDAEWPDNQMCICADCKTEVHVYCYGMRKIQSVWKCGPCSGSKNAVSCVLCNKFNGVMKPTLCGRYAHIICALFTLEAVFVNYEKEYIDLSNVKASFKMCQFCKKNTTYSTKCDEKNCQNRFHITCAQENNTLKERKGETDSSVNLVGYCIEHKKLNRQIFADIIKDAFERENSKQKGLAAMAKTGQNKQIIISRIII